MAGVWTLDESARYADSIYSKIIKPIKNLFDISKATTGYYIDYTNGQLAANAEYVSSDFIPVTANTQYTRTYKHSVAFYNQYKQFISGIAYGEFTFTTPADCCFVRVTASISNYNTTYQLEKGTKTTKYEAYKLGLDADLQFVPDGTLSYKAFTSDIKLNPLIKPRKNLVDKTAITTGYYVDKDTGLLIANASFAVTEYIEIKPSTKYTRNYPYTSAFYNEDKTYISGDLSTQKSITSPSTAKYYRQSITLDKIDAFQLEEGEIQTAYEPFVPAINAVYRASESSDRNRVVLPPNIYGVVGKELNVYFDNLIIDNADRYEWDVTCTIGQQQDERFTVTPSSTGTSTLKIEAYTDYEYIVGAGQSNIVVSPITNGSGVTRTVGTIGDSTTAAQSYQSYLNSLFDDVSDPMSITFVGTQGSAPTLNEGYSGKTVHWLYTNAASPFVFSGVFDYAQYLTTHSFTAPDRVTIHLGINDFYSGNYVSDIALNAAIPGVLTEYEAMVTNIMTAGVTKVGILVTIPPARHQDAFGKDYGCGATRWRHKRNILLWSKALIDQFKGRESSGIYVVPINLGLDTEHNMSKATETPYNSRTTLTVARQDNGVHPALSGYAQIADQIYAWLKSLES